MKVVGVVGMPASGKGEVAAMAGSLGFRVIRFHNVVSSEANRLGFRGPLALTIAGNQLRRTHGPAFFANAIVSKIRKLKSKKVFIEGIRAPEEIATLRNAFPDFTCIAVVASQSARFHRARARARRDDPRELAILREKDRVERSWGVPKAVRMADRILMNQGSLENFRVSAKRLLAEVTK